MADGPLPIVRLEVRPYDPAPRRELYIGILSKFGELKPPYTKERGNPERYREEDFVRITMALRAEGL